MSSVLKNANLLSIVVLLSFLLATPVWAAKNDFNSDGTSDILYQHCDDGRLMFWSMNSFAKTIHFTENLASLWDVVGKGDFNGDGTTDVLYMRGDGTTAIGEIGNYSLRDVKFPGGINPVWRVEGVGDFNGDGTDDILWRKRTSHITMIWGMENSTRTSVTFPGGLAGFWDVAGVGDFNNNGIDDIVYQHNSDGRLLFWEMANFSRVNQKFASSIANTWKVVGVGDFNDDNTDDVLYRKNDGMIAIAEFKDLNRSALRFPGGISTNWKVKDIGDYDGDGTDDIFFRRTTDGVTLAWGIKSSSRNKVAWPGGLAANWVAQSLMQRSYELVGSAGDFFVYQVHDGITSEENLNTLRPTIESVIGQFVEDTIGALITPDVDYSATVVKVLSAIGILPSVSVVMEPNSLEAGQSLVPMIVVSTGSEITGTVSPTPMDMLLYKHDDSTGTDNLLTTLSTGDLLPSMRGTSVYVLIPKKSRYLPSNLPLLDGSGALKFTEESVYRADVDLHGLFMDNLIEDAKDYVAVGDQYWWNSEGTQMVILNAELNSSNQIQLTYEIYPALQAREFKIYRLAENGPSTFELISTRNYLIGTGEIYVDETAYSGWNCYFVNHIQSANDIVSSNDVCVEIPEFIDDGNNTVTDMSTGLMWEKLENIEEHVQMTVAEAEAACQQLTTGGFQDWRLPEIWELETLSDYTVYPKIKDVFPLYNTGDWSYLVYHSSTPPPAGYMSIYPSSNAWYALDIMRGTISLSGSYLATNHFNKRCVRGVLAQRDDFQNNGNGTISDNITGLMWQQSSSASQLLYNDAESYCQDQTLAGHDDWRLPDISELISILSFDDYNPATNTAYFDTSLTSVYWSSTPTRSVGISGIHYVEGVNSPTDRFYGSIGKNAITNKESQVSSYNGVKCVR